MFHGPLYSVTDHGISLRATRPSGPQVWFAALVEAAVKRAARVGNAWPSAKFTTLGASQSLMQ